MGNMEYLSTDDMLPNTLPGYHAMPGAPGVSYKGCKWCVAPCQEKHYWKSCLEDTLLGSLQGRCKLQNLPDRQTDPLTFERNVAHGMLLKTYKYRSNEVHEVQND